MSKLVLETIVWAMAAAASLSAITALFVWAPWDRRRRVRKPEEHPAE